jgi:hypothetical protein
MTRNPEFGNVTETKDKDYDIIWFTKAGLSNVLRLETHIRTPRSLEMTNSPTLSSSTTRKPQKMPRKERSYLLSA